MTAVAAAASFNSFKIWDVSTSSRYNSKVHFIFDVRSTVTPAMLRNDIQLMYHL